MELNEKAKKYFENQAKLKKRFGPYAKYLPIFYQQVCTVKPELADELLDRLDKIKVHFKENYDTGFKGKTTLKAYDGKYSASINLIINDYKITEKENYGRISSFYHEMLHAIPGVFYTTCREDDNLKPWEYYKQANNNGDMPTAITGNIFQDIYRTKIDFSDYVGSTIGVAYIEEGVVEDWAHDIMTQSGYEDEWSSSVTLLEKISYPLFTMLCGMWNLASDNQLRKEYLTGVPDGTKQSEQTEIFKNKMYALIKQMPYRNNKAKALETYQIDSLCATCVDVVRYCESCCDVTKLSIEERTKFNLYKNAIYSGAPLCRALCLNNKTTKDEALRLNKEQILDYFNNIRQFNESSNAKNIMQRVVKPYSQMKETDVLKENSLGNTEVEKIM